MLSDKFEKMTDYIVARYKDIEKRILRSLASSGIQHRTGASSGLWLGPLTGLSATATILNESVGAGYSEICLLTGITGIGLAVACVCLYGRLAMKKVVVKDFQLVYFLPAMITSILYLLLGNKGLLVSVAWGLGVGILGTWGVLQSMACFPHCFTIGEASAVVHGIILFLLSTAANLPYRYHLPPIREDNIITVILQVGILYVASICILCTFFPHLRVGRNFYATALGVLLLAVIPLLHILLDQSPLHWIIFFIFSDFKRIILISYWMVCVAFAIGAIARQILLNSQASTAIRKHFHVLAVLVYIPGMIYDPSLLYLASGTIMCLFLMLEIIRILGQPPLGDLLQKGFSVFADNKDSLVSLTPLYLLCGLSFPLWMPASNLDLLSLLSGVLTVGLGDTAASFVGSNWGKHKWSSCEKSIEGTLACILIQLTVVYCLGYFGYVEGFVTLVKATLSIIGISIVEARTDQIDNLALPLLMYLALRI
ncbi:dolichol kinase [Cephus cinctus]|uniref:dolichol kinase n=1 Tax=Cephus cinctus TaxID=211228 RepID=A0AAJ7FP65_CEPCN|nr:dolichol kinase [Cephus cinctus]